MVKSKIYATEKFYEKVNELFKDDIETSVEFIEDDEFPDLGDNELVIADQSMLDAICNHIESKIECTRAIVHEE